MSPNDFNGDNANAWNVNDDGNVNNDNVNNAIDVRPQFLQTMDEFMTIKSYGKMNLEETIAEVLRIAEEKELTDRRGN